MIAAPRGSVTIEGWTRNEVELTADIELKGPTEADLDQLATVNSFVFDEDLNHLSILTTGTLTAKADAAKATLTDGGGDRVHLSRDTRG